MKQIMIVAGLLLGTIVTATAQESNVNILSYNVRNCIGMDGKRDYQRTANVILQASPDVVALQEMDSASTRNEGVYTLGKLAELTGMHPTYAAAIPFQGGLIWDRHTL